MKSRRKFTPEFKAKVVIEALKERLTHKEIAAKYDLHTQQVTNWKKEFVSGASTVFGKKKKSIRSQEEEEKDDLLRTIGQLKVENDFLKKVLK